MDYGLIIADGLILMTTIVYLASKKTSPLKCRQIEIKEEKLTIWRWSLYSGMTSIWLAGYFTFVSPSLIKVLFHGLFLSTTVFMMTVSIPSWLCKKFGYGGMCHCDFYKYNDFIPMLIVGSIGALNFAIFPLSQLQALTLLIIYILYALVIAFLLPQKEIQPLKYPPQLLIQNIDQFQEFLMTNPQERKLITMVKATCDFCAIQVAELNQIPLDILSSRLRILDLSIMKIDPILGMTLNISPDELDKVPVPSTRVYDAGMEVELKEGVLSSPEIQALLL